MAVRSSRLGAHVRKLSHDAEDSGEAAAGALQGAYSSTGIFTLKVSTVGLPLRSSVDLKEPDAPS